jgi:cytochrome c-type biogenesis protein CcsB
MVDEQLAGMSVRLFHIALLTYVTAMVAYFLRLAFTRVSADGDVSSTAAGHRVGLLGSALAVAGVVLHAGSVLARGLAAGRVPWANMYEYSSVVALLAVVLGLVVVQRRMGYGHLVGFVLALAVLSMTVALPLFTPAGPVVPALQSYWIRIHTAAAMAASGVFMVGFAATALYLLKDTAERRVVTRGGASYSGSTVGAAHVEGLEEGLEDQPRPEGYEADDELGEWVASPLVQRRVLSAPRLALVPFVGVLGFTLLVWRTPGDAFLAGAVAAALGLLAWYAVPHLPPAAHLDNLAYRTIAFGFPIWTFAVIAGAIWAEEAWGRYWGWDPKETSAFFTWVLYACYLHARSTHVWRGRRAAWVAVGAFVALLVTYYAVNLWVVGLHSYAGV